MITQIRTTLFLIGMVLLFQSCDDFGQGGDNDFNSESPEDIAEFINALPQDVTYPLDNPYSAEKAELGRLLFWDPVLSGAKDVSCATCHHPDFGYADGIRLSLGVGGQGLATNRSNGVLIQRNSPTIINTAFNGIENLGFYDPSTAPMFWDNRATSLEDQALQPMLSKEEMRGEHIAEAAIMDTIMNRLQNIADYRTRFAAAFGDNNITTDRILKAIATFERGIVANDSRFDQYMRGNTNAMNNEEIQGMIEFIEVGCADCHSGPMFSDYELHVLGVPEVNNNVDAGANGTFAFRTPTLRNLGVTGPYMHNGRFNTLEDVLDFYDDISDGRNNAINDNINRNDLDDEVRDLQLGGQDIDEIVAFLNTLNDNSFDKTIPASVPSQLPVGGNIEN